MQEERYEWGERECKVGTMSSREKERNEEVKVTLNIQNAQISVQTLPTSEREGGTIRVRESGVEGKSAEEICLGENTGRK